MGEGCILVSMSRGQHGYGLKSSGQLWLERTELCFHMPLYYDLRHFSCPERLSDAETEKTLL